MTASNRPLASAIVPTFGDWDALAGCLRCLSEQTLDRGAFEIVVGNNNPSPDAPGGFVLPPNARMVWQPQPGSYAARNAAVAASRGEVLFFTDADCCPRADWIEQGLAALAAEPSLGRLAGGIECLPSGPTWTIPELYDRFFTLRQTHYAACGYAATANLIVRRSLFDAVGPFDESLLSSGDKEWNMRACRLGERISYAAAAVVGHRARTSLAAHARKRERIVGGRLALKRCSAWRAAIPAPKLLVPAVARIARLPGLTLSVRLRLAWFDYRLRLREIGMTVRIARRRT